MRSDLTDDLLSGVLRLVSACPVVAGGFSAGGPWAIRFPRPSKLKFFAIVKGRCWLAIDGFAAPLRVEAGDIFLLRGEHAFVLASDPAVPPVDALTLFSGSAPTRSAVIGDGGDCVQIGGHVRLDPANDTLLLEMLPPLIHVDGRSEQAAVLQWLLARLVRELEVAGPGSALASNHLSQMMFIEILRVHLASHAALAPGWLRAIGDARLGPALKRMHDEPERNWRLDELASAAAMSRTAFAVHFREVAGVAPLAWLTQWRMHLARRALADEHANVAVLAARLGYASESAFSSAFKRVTGVAPSAYRRASRAEADRGELGEPAV
ncbi:AraC family transcriptional regulator [Burkholderia perseverans]|uniref:AraC family transcriptional regulator n=1 Tax=Burkholderia perseverans TaxID=2615214 RepID=UPI001FEF255C|nr:AraC family transcriptional regulator [Burkholderia perseverans]